MVFTIFLFVSFATCILVAFNSGLSLMLYPVIGTNLLGSIMFLVLGISGHRRRVIMQDSGGDALDAVIAGLGGWRAFHGTHHSEVMRDNRYCREGRVYS